MPRNQQEPDHGVINVLPPRVGDMDGQEEAPDVRENADMDDVEGSNEMSFIL